ncbi:MAG: sporulation initiation factor Spo0A C-terminal domain-containing protein [Clostridia bacterium]|nr:sporulation initiation factor Spo0A C-terminal domain-containing protein [Clostridia bacterium]
MSESINLGLKNSDETDSEELNRAALRLLLPDEDNHNISEAGETVDEKIIKRLAEAIMRMTAEEERERLRTVSVSEFEEATTFILGEFGIPAHTKGYRYLREAIVLVAQRPLMIDGITKSLYPAIADIYGTTSVRVERVVRHAIESGCTKGDTQALYHYFPHIVSEDKLKPTNAEFIAVIGDVVKKRVSKRQLTFADI